MGFSRLVKNVLFFLPVFFHLLDFSFFKRFIATAIGLLGVSGFPMVIVGDPVFFYVMASPALSGSSEITPFITRSDRFNMLGRIKIFMNVTAFAVFINNIITLGRGELPIKGIFNTPLSAPARKDHHEPKQCQAMDFIQSLCVKDACPKRKHSYRWGEFFVSFRRHFNPEIDSEKRHGLQTMIPWTGWSFKKKHLSKAGSDPFWIMGCAEKCLPVVPGLRLSQTFSVINRQVLLFTFSGERIFHPAPSQKNPPSV